MGGDILKPNESMTYQQLLTSGGFYSIERVERKDKIWWIRI